MKVTGYIGKPIISRGNRNYENYFINGRYIKSSLISRAIEDAYKPYMMQHKYPFTALHISIDSGLLDVNVHPTKMELRFRNQEQIYPFILKMVDDAIARRELIPEAVCGSEKEKHTEQTAKIKEEKKLVAYKPLPEPFEVKRRDNLATSSNNSIKPLNVDNDSYNRFKAKSILSGVISAPIQKDVSQIKNVDKEEKVDYVVNEKTEKTNIDLKNGQ